MGLNTYPSNPFPPSTDRMDADALEAEVSQLKSGLTNVDVALSVPEGTGKNVLPMSLSDIKRCNTYGTWADNVYTYNGITFTVNLDGNGDIANIKTTGTASAKADFIIADNNTPNIKAIMNGKSVTLNGCPANGSSATYSINGWQVSTTASSARDTGSGVTFNAINMSSSFNFAVSIANGYEIATAGLLFYPMVRLSSVADSTFSPYIPSVESRIEAVEKMPMKQWQKNTSGSAENVTFTFSSSVNRYAGLLFCINNSGASAIFAVAYKEDIEPLISRLAGSDTVTPSISIDGSITVGLKAWSTAILFANGNFV